MIEIHSSDIGSMFNNQIKVEGTGDDIVVREILCPLCRKWAKMDSGTTNAVFSTGKMVIVHNACVDNYNSYV